MDNLKNNTLELLKLFASYMVVFIHVIFSGYIGVAVETLARFAVPFFFLISGFYSYLIPPEKIINRIKKILALIIFSVVFYTVFNVLWRLSTGGWNDVCSYVMQYLYISNWVKLIVLNVPICLEYLWYLYAMLYVYAIYYFATIYHINDKVIFTISFSILFLQILLGEVFSFLGIVLPGLVMRNFAVMGISFFGLGLFAKKHQNKFHSISNPVILLSIIIGILESICSRYFFEKKEIYIGSLLVVFAFVCLFIKYPNIKSQKFITSLAGCSTYVYIFHDMISKSIRTTYMIFGVDMYSSVVLKNLHPIIVCIISTIFAYLLIKTQKYLKRHKNNARFCKELT